VTTERNSIVVRAEYDIGDVVHHKMFGYRGVIVDVDPCFVGTDAWYDSVAQSRPPKDRPWYHVLRHGCERQTYVAERNLEPDTTGMPIDHPLLPLAFDAYQDGRYHRRDSLN